MGDWNCENKPVFQFGRGVPVDTHKGLDASTLSFRYLSLDGRDHD